MTVYFAKSAWLWSDEIPYFVAEYSVKTAFNFAESGSPF